MTSIAKMPPAEAAAACEALFRYCELDTLAMVKVWEKWGSPVFFRVPLPKDPAQPEHEERQI